jgi:hypothetical protein
MANRHFAKFGDVWKHLPLVEILAIERPHQYWESHAGSAVYPMVDDPERRYGIGHFAEAAPSFAGLDASRYRHHVASLNGSPEQVARYPGSAMLAMLELGTPCFYLLCDLDPDSAADLRTASTRLGLDEQVDVRDQDGMEGLQQALSSIRPDDAVVVHVDPYDPWDVGPSGWSALDLAAAVITAGIGLVYWYGYDRPADRGWALTCLSARAPSASLWSADMLVTTDTSNLDGGHFGTATTPGTGCGVVCANISQQAIQAVQRLGDELAIAYADTPLPDGNRGRLDFVVRPPPTPR